MQLFTPMQYLQIDIASNFGLDRDDWDIRLMWFEANKDAIEDLAKIAIETPTKIPGNALMKAADSPALFFAGIKAWDRARRGESIGYPISLDATASGAQLLAILIGCEKSASLCNVTDTGRREDFYDNIQAFMSQRLNGADVASRDDAKQAIMPSFYGSTASPKRVFGEGEKLEVFFNTMEEETPGLWALNQALLELWQPNAYSHDWVLPDNFHVKTKVMSEKLSTVTFLEEEYTVHSYENRPSAHGLSIGANVIHSIDGMVVREMSRRCSYDPAHMEILLKLLSKPVTQLVGATVWHGETILALWDHYQDTGFLSARILELLDESNIHLVDPAPVAELISTLPDVPFPVLSVHDCFRCHPNNGDDLRKQYNQILHDLAKSNILASIATQITGAKVTVHKYGSFADKILKADYALS